MQYTGCGWQPPVWNRLTCSDFCWQSLAWAQPMSIKTCPKLWFGSVLLPSTALRDSCPAALRADAAESSARLWAGRDWVSSAEHQSPGEQNLWLPRYGRGGTKRALQSISKPCRAELLASVPGLPNKRQGQEERGCIPERAQLRSSFLTLLVPVTDYWWHRRWGYFSREPKRRLSCNQSRVWSISGLKWRQGLIDPKCILVGSWCLHFRQSHQLNTNCFRKEAFHKALSFGYFVPASFLTHKSVFPHWFLLVNSHKIFQMKENVLLNSTTPKLPNPEFTDLRCTVSCKE